MTHQPVSRTNQPSKSDTPLVSGVLQRAAVRTVPEKDVQPIEEEATPFRESRFHHNFSQVPASTGEMPMIQPKLKIGAVGDRYEQEADRVAQNVVQRINAPAPERGNEDEVRRKTQEGTLQHEEIPEEEDDKQLRMKPMVQRLSAEGGMAAPPNLDSSIQRARGGGQPLGDEIREPMERAFGADFSGVKVHTDSHSDQLNQSIQAKAFTTGQDVFFRHGAYQPGSRGGQELIAHELTHVVQQNGGAVQRSPLPPQQLQQPPTVSGTAAEVIQRKGVFLPSLQLPGIEKEDTDSYSELVKAVKKYIDAPESGEPHKDLAQVWKIELLFYQWTDERRKLSKPVKLSEDQQKFIDELPKKISDEKKVINKEQNSLEFAFLHQNLKRQRDQQSSKNRNDDGFAEVLALTNNKKYREVLEKYDYNWFTAKEHLAYTTYAKDSKEYAHRMNVMKKLLTYRKQEIRRILNPVMERVAQEIMTTRYGNKQNFTFKEMDNDKGYMIAVKNQELIIASAPGSQTLTSDIDITFNVLGDEDYEIDLVKQFNSKFRADWKGLSSGIVFDVNAYTSGFMSKAYTHFLPERKKLGSLSNEQKEAQKPWKPLKYILEKEQGKDVKETKHVTQIALGFLPIRKYFTKNEGDWEAFRKSTLSTLEKDIYKKLNALNFSIGDTKKVWFFAYWDVNAIFDKTEQLYQETEEALSKKREALENERKESNLGALSEEHLNALAGDQLYEAQLDKINELLLNRRILVTDITEELEKSSQLKTDAPELKDLQTELAENMNRFEVEQGKALVYANEAYYTAGAAIHVVKGIQLKEPITLGRQQQMASLLMNIGYKLMHDEHNRHQGGAGRALVATSKYGERIRDLVRQGQGEAKGARKAIYKQKVDPKLHELLGKDIAVIDNEKKLIDDYKKTGYLKSPAAREASAHKDLSQDMSEEKIKKTYLRMAQSVLGPFYVNKYVNNKLQGKDKYFW